MKRSKQVKNPYLKSISPNFKQAKKKKLQIQIIEDEVSPELSPTFKQFGKNSPNRSQFPPVALKNKSILNERNQSGTPKQEGIPKNVFPVTPSKKVSQSLINSNKSTPKEISRTFKFPLNASKVNSNVFLRNSEGFTVPHLKKIDNPKASRLSHTPTHRRLVQNNGRMTPTHKVITCQKDCREPNASQKAETEPSITISQLSELVTKVPQQAINQPINNQKNQKQSDLESQEIVQRQEKIYRDHLFQTFQAMKVIQQIQSVDTVQLKNKRVYLPKLPTHINCKTLVLDLDETLVHCCDEISQNPDIILPVTFPSNEIAGINIRPFAKELLLEASKN